MCALGDKLQLVTAGSKRIIRVMTHGQLKLRKQSHALSWTYTFFFQIWHRHKSFDYVTFSCNNWIDTLKVVYYGKITLTIPVVGSKIAMTMWKTDVGITGKMSTGCSGDTIGNIRNDLKKMFSHCIHLCIYSEIFFPRRQ